MTGLKGSVDPSLQSSSEAKVCDFEICRDGAYPDKHTRFICDNSMKIWRTIKITLFSSEENKQVANCACITTNKQNKWAEVGCH